MRLVITFAAIIIVLIIIGVQLGQDSQKNWAGFGLANFFEGAKKNLPQETIKEEEKETEPEEIEELTESPYIGKIKISGVSINSSNEIGKITLSTRLEKKETINITGWKLEGEGGTYIVPLGTKEYSFTPSQEKETKDIVIEKGDGIYLSTTETPLGKTNAFQINKCFGYLKNYYDFEISVSKICPKPGKEDILYLSGCCSKFILGLNRCELPDYSEEEEIINDAECKDYLFNNLNYSGCSKNYSQDDDFLKNEWHIYMNKDILVFDDWDTLYLKDDKGFVVDSYFYGCPTCLKD